MSNRVDKKKINGDSSGNNKKKNFSIFFVLKISLKPNFLVFNNKKSLISYNIYKLRN